MNMLLMTTTRLDDQVVNNYVASSTGVTHLAFYAGTCNRNNAFRAFCARITD